MFQVIIGLYEAPLYGFEASFRKDPSGEFKFVMQQLFAYLPHSGCIKALAAQGRWLVSASTDESMKLYDLKRRKEMGVIQQTEGPINCIEFIGNTHMMSAGESGKIDIWDTKTWQIEKTLKGHKGRINSLSVHPSCVLALSTSKDKTLRLWDLTTGKCAHSTNLSYEADIVRWSPDGELFVLVDNSRILVFDKKGKQLKSFSETKRILSIAFIKNRLLATGGEDRQVNIWDLDSESGSKPIRSLTGCENRIKGISVVYKPVLDENGNIAVPASTTVPSSSDDDDGYPYIVVISSDERLRIWDLDVSDNPIITAKIGGRLTSLCCAVAPKPSEKKKNPKKRKREEVEEHESDE